MGEHFFKRVLSKLVFIVLITAFSLNASPDGLGTLPSSQNPLVKRKVLAKLRKTQIQHAAREEEMRLFAINNTPCILLSSGRYLVSAEIAKDNLLLLGEIVRANFRSLMKVFSVEDAYKEKYEAIKKMILERFPPDEKSMISYDEYVQDTCARGFKWLYLVGDKEGVLFRDEVPLEEKPFIDAFEQMISEDKGNSFSEEFWNPEAREKLLMEARGNMSFYTAMDLADEISGGRYTELVMVPGHGIYVGKSREDTSKDKGGWIGGFRGEGSFYAEHARGGVEFASENPGALVMFSGGFTREAAGERSEAESYYEIASQFDWWSHPEVAARARKEDGARDSLENVIFAMYLFRQETGYFPEKVTVTGWQFKTDRFNDHAMAVGFPLELFDYTGVNNPEEEALKSAEKFEKKKTEAAKKDPRLEGDEWEKQRKERDPFDKKARQRYFEGKSITEAVGEIIRERMVPYDKGESVRLVVDLLKDRLDRKVTYTIKYDDSRLSASQIEVIRQYKKWLEERSSARVRMNPMSSEIKRDKSEDSLISVYCSGKDFKGEGHVDIAITEGTVDEYLLRLTNMINIAMAASIIPEGNLTREELETTYGPIVGFIKSQYKSILGKDLNLSGPLEDMIENIRCIVLELPPAYKLHPEEIEKYNTAVIFA